MNYNNYCGPGYKPAYYPVPSHLNEMPPMAPQHMVSPPMAPQQMVSPPMPPMQPFPLQQMGPPMFQQQVVPNQAPQPQPPEPKKNRFTKQQKQILITQWCENFNEIQSARCNQVWPDIVKKVSKHGQPKSLNQCKQKIWSFKDKYHKCKKQMGQSTGGAAVKKCEYFDEIDKVLSDRDVENLPEFYEVGAGNGNEIEPSENFDVTTPPTGEKNHALDTDTEPCSASSAIKRKLVEENEAQDDLDSSLEYVKHLETDVRKRSAKKVPRKEKPKTFQEQLIEMQQEQIKVFERSEENFQKFQLSMYEKQLEAEAKDKEKEREFFLKFGQMFAGNKDNSNKNK